jgi:LCP family protein required for cell wall assembly
MGGGVDDALWQGVPARDLPWSESSDEAAAAAASSRSLSWLRPLLAALSSFLFVGFIGGGLYVGALALYQVSLRQAETGTVVPETLKNTVSALAGGTAAGTLIAPTSSSPRPEFLLKMLPDWQGTEPFNILLLGVDQRDNEVAQGIPARSDTMILVRIDPKAKSAGMISIPRDLWVDIPGFGQGKINTAYTYGELNKARIEGGGPSLAKRTVEQVIGLKVDYYGRVDFHGLEQIIDTMGGIVVDVERPIKDDAYPTENYGVERLYVPAGLQYMDGHMALRYARSRHSENDFGRMRRQQRVLFAIRQRALQLNMLLRAPSLVGQARDMVGTDLRLDQLVPLAKLAQQIDSEHVHSLVIDSSFVREIILRDGADVLVPDKDRVRRAVASLVSGMNPQQAARIEVLNGSGRPGLAADTAKFLLNLGYDVVRIDDADRSDYGESVLEVPAGRRSLAEDLAATLKLPRWTPREPRATATDDVDVRIIVGREFRLPQPEATPTLATSTDLPPPPERR